MRMRTARLLTVASPLLALASAVVPARAQQLDLNPPKPNVLLLVDNSGSMERMIDGSLPGATPANACDVTACQVLSNGTTCTWAPSSPASPNRWNTLLTTLVGSPTNGYHCVAMPRDQGSSSTFAQEYEIAGVTPYDNGYYLPYHRMVAKDTTTNPSTTIPCTFAPGDLPGAMTGSGVGPNGYGAGGTADSFPANAIVNRPYGQVTIDQSSAHSMACQFAINNDGVLTAYQDILRFSLMTFDNDPDPGTGVSAAAPLSVVNPAFKGMWSYFPFWNGGGAGAPATGTPQGCASGQSYELGARNSAAPPWEGRLVPFPPASDAATARETQNQQLRSVLSATRAYGGTPIAGMLQDAQNYLWNDPSGPGDPTNGDQYIKNGCRQQYIILLTDGAPNQDLRPSCGSNDNPSAPCPFNMPETTVTNLLAGGGGHQSVQTFVIGFAVSSGVDQGNVSVDCTQLKSNSADCQNPTASLAPCCELQKIAVAGQPPANNPSAYFVNTGTDLQAALNAILAKIGQGQTTRTLPAYSGATNDITSSSGTVNQATYYASFTPGVPSPVSGSLTNVGTPWTGNIQRNRYLCSAGGSQPGLQTNLGDDFGLDMATGGTRHFVALLPSSTPAVDSSATIRPYAAATVGDGLGNYTATQYVDTATGIVGVITPPALGLTAGTQSCQYTSGLGSGTGWLTDTQCAAMLLDFTFGQPFGGGPSGFPFVSRTGNTPTGRALALGGIYHASPVVVGPPGALLHDDAYDLFRTSTQTTTLGMASSSVAKTRDTIVYAATTDGLLHAFWADVANQTQNEEWALIPPAVMPQLQSAYPGANQFLLDGTPVVKDVIWDRKQGSTMATQGPTVNPWHTTLVAGFGPSQLGYYAVDVTNPVYSVAAKSAVAPPEATPTDPKGPIFLWQLTKVPQATNMPLFGGHGATPAITQVAITESDGFVHEVGVAILPGGWDKAATTPAAPPGCERYAHNKGIAATWGPTSGFLPRVDVRCWGTTGKFADPVVGRSVTVVRLDTGEVIASFMRATDASVAHPNDTLLHAGRIVDTPLDSPMTGTPAVYPGQTGANALRFFIADIDGTIWRFDISNPDPTKWQGKLFYDLYNQTTDTQNSADDWANGQPVALPLSLSLDRQGRVVVHAASGSQDSFDFTGPNYVVSLTETVQTISSTTDFHAGVNWWMGSALPAGSPQLPSTTMDVGERVSGPFVVFNNSVFFTTYYAGQTGSNTVCNAGDARLWQADYINANTAGVGTGGVIQGNPPGNKPWTDLAPTVGVGVVVPGISIQQQTACATVSTSADQYVPGVNHTSASTYTAGTFSLVYQSGKSNGTGGVQTYSRPLASPNTATLIDSWAMVTE